MDDKSDHDSSLCEDCLRNKWSVRKRRSAGRESHMSASVGRGTTFRTSITAPSGQTKTSNPHSCEKEKLNSCGRFAEKGNFQVKEEHLSSGEEDTLGKREEHLSSGEEDTSGKREEHLSSGEEDTLGKREEHLSSGEEDTSGKREEHLSSGEEDTSGKREEHLSSREEDTSGKREEHLSSREEDTSGKREEHLSSREEDTSGKREEHLSSREEDTSGKREEHLSSGEEDTSGKGEKPVSCREENTLGKGEEHVFSVGEDASSGEGDLGNIETVLVQDSPVTQHQHGLDMLKFNIGRSKEISKDLRKQVVEAHKSGKGYKRIAKDLDLHQSTVRQIVYKWKKFSTVATLPRSGRPTKISARARCTILKHLTENPGATAKDLKASLALDNINVHESTIRKTLNKWCSWDFIMEEDTALQQE